MPLSPHHARVVLLALLIKSALLRGSHKKTFNQNQETQTDLSIPDTLPLPLSLSLYLSLSLSFSFLLFLFQCFFSTYLSLQHLWMASLYGSYSSVVKVRDNMCIDGALSSILGMLLNLSLCLISAKQFFGILKPVSWLLVLQRVPI